MKPRKMLILIGLFTFYNIKYKYKLLSNLLQYYLSS